MTLRPVVVVLLAKADLGFMCVDITEWTVDGRRLTAVERDLVETATNDEWDAAEALVILDESLPLTVPPGWA
jgi:hypothetical protein